MKKINIIIIIIFLTHLTSAQHGVSELPSPKEKGQEFFVSNPDYVINQQTEDSLNVVAQEIELKSSSEFAMVIIEDFIGDDDFEYALEVFKSWSIGKSQNDNGLLLLVAKKRKVYRFITGYGMEGVLPDAMLKRIGETYLVPNFQEGRFDEGMLKAAAAIHTILTGDVESEELFAKTLQSSFWDRNLENLIYSLLIFLLGFMILKWMSYQIIKKVPIGKKPTNQRSDVYQQFRA
ncbi:TPM domain-containing protein [Belliella sp. DSM 111904]|uniref:TPM domain-containing protein n=1 Tax=Belliella filtrata TaxID=2923435 RepID=A0ABS9UZ29_9BACT|nr:TPM domain-containing protein [Belliella filtrata]MCH7409369.1 TPM domain-containing protein [Belliella filtrata]